MTMHVMVESSKLTKELPDLNYRPGGVMKDYFAENLQNSGLVLYQCPGISSPILTGFLHPFLVLPGELCREWETKLTEEQRVLRMEYVLRHELIHLKRLDLYYKWLVQAVVCIHWFTRRSEGNLSYQEL